jgi:hypothetical protein
MLHTAVTWHGCAQREAKKGNEEVERGGRQDTRNKEVGTRKEMGREREMVTTRKIGKQKRNKRKESRKIKQEESEKH